MNRPVGFFISVKICVPRVTWQGIYAQWHDLHLYTHKLTSMFAQIALNQLDELSILIQIDTLGSDHPGRSLSVLTVQMDSTISTYHIKKLQDQIFKELNC